MCIRDSHARVPRCTKSFLTKRKTKNMIQMCIRDRWDIALKTITYVSGALAVASAAGWIVLTVQSGKKTTTKKKEESES